MRTFASPSLTMSASFFLLSHPTAILAAQGQDSRHVHGGGEGVVGGLGHIDVVVGVAQLFGGGDVLGGGQTGGQDARAVRHHLVDIHVGLGPAPRLPYGQGKVAVQLARYDLVAGTADGRASLGGHAGRAEGGVGLGGGLFEVAEGADDLGGHLFGADGEVFETPLGLRAPAARHLW